MGISKKDLDILDFLHKCDRESLGEDICEVGHHFPKGKYDFCPICMSKFKADIEKREEPTVKIDLEQECNQDVKDYFSAIEAAEQYLNNIKRGDKD